VNNSGGRGGAIHNRGTLNLAGVTFSASRGLTDHAMNSATLWNLGTINVTGTLTFDANQTVY
jgi:hypothetical protein